MASQKHSEAARAHMTAYNNGLTAEERKQAALRAGKASGEVRRRHRLFRDILKEILSAPLETEDEAYAALRKLGMESPRQEDAILLATAQKAASGDIEAVRFLRDTLGEKPTDSFNLNMSNKPVKSLDLSGLSDEELEALADEADG